MSERLRLILLVLITASVGTACASAGGAPSGSSCTSDLARHERSLDEVVDSVALVRGLAGLWRPQGSLAFAYLPFDSAGRPDSASVIASIPEGERDALGRVILRHARSGALTAERVDLFIGDDQGLAPRRVRELRTCPPEILNRDIVARMLVQEASRLDILATTVVRLYALVEEDGSVGEVRIDRGSSNFDVDAAAVGVIRRTVFEPGRVEGIPTPVWASFPVTFRVVPPRPR